MPAIFESYRSVKPAGSPSPIGTTRAPLVMAPVIAYSTEPVPRVATNESILPSSTSRPLTTPTTVSSTSTTRAASTQFHRFTTSTMVSTWARPRA